MKMSKEEKELELRVGEVLHYLWDPCGVRDEPAARDEYETYIPMVLKEVLQGDSLIVAKKLAEIESKWMSAVSKESKLIEVGRVLVAHKEWVLG